MLGHFQVYFPEEIAHAAGLLPVKVRGGQLDAQHADSHFGSYLCSILRSSLELALSGCLRLDLFVTHPICDAARNLAGIWARNFSYPSRILYLPQNANSRYAAAYLRDEYLRLGEEIEARRRKADRRRTTCAARSPSSTRIDGSCASFTRSSARRRGCCRSRRRTCCSPSAESSRAKSTTTAVERH